MNAAIIELAQLVGQTTICHQAGEQIAPICVDNCESQPGVHHKSETIAVRGVKV